MSTETTTDRGKGNRPDILVTRSVGVKRQGVVCLQNTVKGECWLLWPSHEEWK